MTHYVLVSLTVGLIVNQVIAIDNRLANIGYLGRGYDIVRASPRPVSHPIDGGFVSAIFDMTSYAGLCQTADGRYAVPDFTDVVECTACQMAFESNVITGSSSYRQSVDRQTDGGFSVGKAFSFRAGEAYQNTVEETMNQGNVLVDTAASCLVYCAELRLPLRPTNLDEAFVKAVQLLDHKVDSNSSYMVFLQKFGTHFISAMQSGSLYWQRATFTASNYSKAVEESGSLSIETTAGVSFLKMNFGYEDSGMSATADHFTTLASSIVQHSIGAPPPIRQGSPTNTTVQWLAEARRAPMPIEFRIVPIAGILTAEFFPTELKEKMDQIRSRIIKLIDGGGYCRHLASINTGANGVVNCAEESPDGIQLRKNGVRSNFGGTYYKAGYENIADLANPMLGGQIWDCPTGFQAAWIGGGPHPKGLNDKPFSPVIPGRLYMCRNGTFDFQGAFGGMYSLVNYQGGNVQCKDFKGSTYRETEKCPDPAPGETEFSYSLVAFYGCEYVYACYRKKSGALIGGFYLIDKTRPDQSWPNTLTGVTSCPIGYKGQVLFSQQSKSDDRDKNIYPFESYVCLLV